MARETKFGLLFVLVLTSAFGLLVYKRLHQPLPLMADAETTLADDENPQAPVPLTVADSTENSGSSGGAPELTLPAGNAVASPALDAKSPAAANAPWQPAVAGTPSAKSPTFLPQRPVSPSTTKSTSGLSSDAFAVAAVDTSLPRAKPAALPTDLDGDDFFSTPATNTVPSANAGQTTPVDQPALAAADSAKIAGTNAVADSGPNSEFDPFADSTSSPAPSTMSPANSTATAPTGTASNSAAAGLTAPTDDFFANSAATPQPSSKSATASPAASFDPFADPVPVSGSPAATLPTASAAPPAEVAPKVAANAVEFPADQNSLSNVNPTTDPDPFAAAGVSSTASGMSSGMENGMANGRSATVSLPTEIDDSPASTPATSVGNASDPDPFASSPVNVPGTSNAVPSNTKPGNSSSDFFDGDVARESVGEMSRTGAPPANSPSAPNNSFDPFEAPANEPTSLPVANSPAGMTPAALPAKTAVEEDPFGDISTSSPTATTPQPDAQPNPGMRNPNPALPTMVADDDFPAGPSTNSGTVSSPTANAAMTAGPANPAGVAGGDLDDPFEAPVPVTSSTTAPDFPPVGNAAIGNSTTGNQNPGMTFGGAELADDSATMIRRETAPSQPEAADPFESASPTIAPAAPVTNRTPVAIPEDFPGVTPSSSGSAPTAMAVQPRATLPGLEPTVGTAPRGLTPEFSNNPVTPQAAPIGGDVYIVEPSDNFWTISKRVYGTGRYFQALAKHNSATVGDPQKVRPGARIMTPPVAELERKYRADIPLADAAAVQKLRSDSPERFQPESQPGFFVNPQGQPMYRVGSSDTLSQISQNHLGRSSRWIQIFEMNRDILKDGNSLSIGTVLKLPGDASQVQVVGFEPESR